MKKDLKNGVYFLTMMVKLLLRYAIYIIYTFYFFYDSFVFTALRYLYHSQPIKQSVSNNKFKWTINGDEINLSADIDENTKVLEAPQNKESGWIELTNFTL